MRPNLLLVVRYHRLRLLGLITILVAILSFLIVDHSDFLTVSGSLKQKVIVIDAGHGGIDGGTNKPGFLEKDINLSVAQELKRELTKQGAKVILTRNKDEALDQLCQVQASRHRRDLLARISIIKQAQPDLFLSLHVNANGRRPRTSGPMVFFNHRTPKAEHLATSVQASLNQIASKQNFKEHRQRKGDYLLLNNCPYPGAIVEMGFITNARERETLSKKEYQLQLTKALARGVTQYFSTKPTPITTNPRGTTSSPTGTSQDLVVFFPRLDNDQLAKEPINQYQTTTTRVQSLKSQLNSAVSALINGPQAKNLEPILNPQTKILNLQIKNSIAYVDLSKEGMIVSPGSHQEYQAITALVETVCQFSGVNGLRLTIAGQEMSTFGQHMDISRVLVPQKAKVKIAIVIDDLAGDNTGLDEMLTLGKPLTLAVMPKREHTHTTADMVHNKGYEVFLHIPMEPEHGKSSWLGDGAITTNMTPQEVAKQVREDLADVPHAIGFNNHMGSKITKRSDLMREVLSIAKEKHLIVLDSRTTDQTVIPRLSQELHIPILERSIFLDEVNSSAHVQKQIRELADIAREKGYAIGIGHVGITGKNTARGLTVMVPWLEDQGIELVFASQLLTNK